VGAFLPFNLGTGRVCFQNIFLFEEETIGRVQKPYNAKYIVAILTIKMHIIK
jgi:hypothetical protein